MSKRRRINKTSRIITYILLIACVIAICGSFAYFTGGFTSEFKTFYVTYEGKTILSTASRYELDSYKKSRFDVKYTFGVLNKNIQKGYTVKVVPNESASDFNFTVDGAIYSFKGESDLTKGFDIEKLDEHFFIKPKGEMSDILSALYPDSEVLLNSDDVKTDSDNFMLIITSYNGANSIHVGFNIPARIFSLTLDREGIVL